MFRFLVELASTTLNVMLVLLFPVMLFIPAAPQANTAEEYAQCLKLAGDDPDLKEICAMMKD